MKKITTKYTNIEKKKILAYYNKSRWEGIAKKYGISIKRAKKEYTSLTECEYVAWAFMAGVK